MLTLVPVERLALLLGNSSVQIAASTRTILKFVMVFCVQSGRYSNNCTGCAKREPELFFFVLTLIVLMWRIG